MKNVLLLLGWMVLPFVMKAQKSIIHDANVQMRTIGSFHAIRVSGGIDVYLSQSDNEVVAVSAAKDEYRDRIRTEVENGLLKIYYQEANWPRRSNANLRVYVSFKTLDKITASGASDIILTGEAKMDELSLQMSGASDFKGAIQANSLSVDLSGASDATVLGNVLNLKVEASGASDFKGYDLKADNCSVVASGASDIKITVNKELNAKASGASDVTYKGTAVTGDIKASGASSVTRKG